MKTQTHTPPSILSESLVTEPSDSLELTVLFQPDGFMIDWDTPVKRAGRAAGKAEQTNDNQQQKQWYERFMTDRYSALFFLGFQAKHGWMTPSVAYMQQIAETFLRTLSALPEIEIMRELTELPPQSDELEQLAGAVPFAGGSQYVNADWLAAAWKRLMECFQKEIKVYEGTVAEYFMEHNSHFSVSGRIYFHLVETQDEEFPFAFMATYSTKPVKSRKATHTPLREALIEFKKDKDKLLSLLSAVAKAADRSSLISRLMESGELFSAIRFTAGEAYTFLREVPVYEEAGIMCRVPDWWKRHSHSLRLNVSVGQKEPARVGTDALLDFRPTLSVAGEELSIRQLREFLEMAEGLVLYKGKWVEINHSKLEAALSAFGKAQKLAESGLVTLAQAMRMEMTLEEEIASGEDQVEYTVTNGEWLKTVQDKLRHPMHPDHSGTDPSFRAVLRPYQADGYEWLNTMSSLGLGACLADDMGLGKTVQIIAYLEHYRLNKGGHILLILPASLIGNWQKEIERFAPQMPFQILHKSMASSGELTVDHDSFLCITTYGMTVRLTELSAIHWDAVILDEAQAVKNAGTKQSKAVKAIPSSVKIAMTGTPIENRLSDLWSLFDFLNPGLLGTAKEFTAYTKELSNDRSGYMALRKMISPFILRRLKTDRSIITDLPDKIEMSEYASLSRKQAALYQKLVDELVVRLKSAEGIDRKGLVLASIMKFKQICNHPDQYLGQENFKKENSGKFERLGQICETIYEKRERVLVFTQFKEMTEPLAAFLEQIFHRKGLVLHGGTPVKKRNEMVEVFNGERYIPFMVLSLKAGGVGLNLTAANHVIHFDRWWNPAVENQATDRAFRIGQTKNVMVHKFVTEGTIEEKIDAMIAEKQKLAGDILSTSGENWITELNNEDLMNLFRLGGDKA